MTVERMDNVGTLVVDIDAAFEFFTELGFELEGRAPIQGNWADTCVGRCCCFVRLPCFTWLSVA